VTAPEPIITDDADTVLWRVDHTSIGLGDQCAWCGRGCFYEWMRETEFTLRKLGFFCSALCAERRERRAVT
jgi:hypothetical protein